RNDLLDDFTRGRNARTCSWRNCYMLATNCNGGDLLQREPLTIQLHLRSLVEKNLLGRELDKVIRQKKGQAETRPGLLGEMAQNKLAGSGSISPPSARELERPPCVAPSPRTPPSRPKWQGQYSFPRLTISTHPF